MIWALLEILLPLLLALLVGLFLGWLLWRWRRRSITSHEWDTQVSKARLADAEIASMRSARDEALHERTTLTNRLTAVSGDFDGLKGQLSETRAGNAQLQADLQLATEQASGWESAQAELRAAQDRISTLELDLEGVNARNGMLSEDLNAKAILIGDLKTSSAQFGDLQTHALSLEADLNRANERVSALEGQLGQADIAVSGIADLEENSGRLEGQLAGANARIAELEGQLGRADGLLGDLDGAHARIAELEGQLDQASSATGQLDNTSADLLAARERISMLELSLDGATAKAGMLEEDVKTKALIISEFESASNSADSASEADLNAAQARVAELESDAAEAVRLRGDLSGAKDRIAELESQLAQKPSVSPAAFAAAPVAAAVATNWQKGTTTVGTPGSDHKDDLKVVSGIGPKMEELLNGFGIESWEQLAAFTPADVERVDAALEDFPGRIERDEWVAQAQAILDNGHAPLDGISSATAIDIQSWQSGTTSLGTPGAAHTDDLKVINGIGPVLETTLNEYGIQSWEQLAAFTPAEVETVDSALSFPGRIDRDEWISQASVLVDRFPDRNNRPTRETFLNNSGDDDPFN